MKVHASLIGEEYCQLEVRRPVADRRELAQAFAALIERVYDRHATITFDDECPDCERLLEDGACSNTNCIRNLPQWAKQAGVCA